MNTLRWIPRSLVKALAAGAVLVAASLPLAIATEAGAAVSLGSATIAFTPYNLAGTTTGMTANVTAIGVKSSGIFTISGITGLQNNGGSVVVAGTSGGVVFTKTAETATTISGTYDATSATATASTTFSVNEDSAGAVTSTSTFTIDAAPATGFTSAAPASLVAGTTAPVLFTLTGGGGLSATGTIQAAITSANTGSAGLGLGVTAVAYASATTFTATVAGNFGASAAAIGTAYTLSVMNPDGGLFTANNAFAITASGVTNVSPSSVAYPAGTTSTTAVVINGAGFEPGASAGIGGVDTGTGTSGLYVLTIGTPPVTGALSNEIGVSGATCVNSGQLIGLDVTGTGVPAGTTVLSTNAACALTLSAPLTATGAGEYLFSYPAAATSGIAGTPSATLYSYNSGTGVLTFGSDAFVSTVAVGDTITADSVADAGVAGNLYVTAIDNSAFTITLDTNPAAVTGALTFTPPITSTVSTVTPTAASLSVKVNGPAIYNWDSTTTLWDTYVMNPVTGPTANAQTFQINSFGVGEASTSVAAVTGTTLSPTGPISVGSAVTTTITITGSGFGPSSTVAFYPGTASTPATMVTGSSCVANSAGTTLTCIVVANTGALAGPYNVVVTNLSASNPFNGALTVAGPIITAQSPTSIGVGAPVGTVITFTGTGFNGLTTGTVHAAAGGSIAGIFAVQSATSATLTLSSSPNAADAAQSALGNTPPDILLTQLITGGLSVTSDFALAIGGAPTVSALLNNSGATPTAINSGAPVGTGASNLKILINGTGFVTGAKVGSFVNANSVADAGVTIANVTFVSSTQLSATLSIAAGDVNLADGYTVTNPSGASVAVLAYGVGSLYMEAGPTITSVSPSTVTPSTTMTFTLTGTGFKAANSTVTSSSTNATCGSTTFVSSTSLTVGCTFGAVTSGVNLIVTNLDGGMATFALTAPAVVTPPAKVNPFTKGIHLPAIHGRGADVRVLGGGFFAQPHVTSNGSGARATVSHDYGTSMIVHITVTANGARGWHTLTFTFANGKVCKANYLTK